jgi:uncharacterized protein DUF4236
MGFLRFRRTFRIGPGLRLNLSKSGVSASVGRRGSWFTVGPRGTRETVGIPGTGLSYTEQQRIRDAPATLAAALPIDGPGRVSELPASVAATDGAPASSSGGLLALVLLALLVLAILAIAIWA